MYLKWALLGCVSSNCWPEASMCRCLPFQHPGPRSYATVCFEKIKIVKEWAVPRSDGPRLQDWQEYLSTHQSAPRRLSQDIFYLTEFIWKLCQSRELFHNAMIWIATLPGYSSSSTMGTSLVEFCCEIQFGNELTRKTSWIRMMLTARSKI